MKQELKIAMVLDNYKLPIKEAYWKNCLKNYPNIERDYVLDREEQFEGPGRKITSLIRYYRLKLPS